MSGAISVPDTRDQAPPRDWTWKSAMWLLGRHPRLLGLACRVRGVMDADGIDVDHLAEVFAGGPNYRAAWDEYERTHRPPSDDDGAAQERWYEAGPKADEFAEGLADLLVMSSGEVASLRLLACFGAAPIPFTVSHFRSLDAEGQRLLADWCDALKAS